MEKPIAIRASAHENDRTNRKNVQVYDVAYCVAAASKAQYSRHPGVWISWSAASSSFFSRRGVEQDKCTVVKHQSFAVYRGNTVRANKKPCEISKVTFLPYFQAQLPLIVRPLQFSQDQERGIYLENSLKFISVHLIDSDFEGFIVG